MTTNPTTSVTNDLPARDLPLAGLTVLDLGQIYQGPYCGFLLAMAGADVIKIEPPHGEPVRSRRESLLPLAMLNSNKRGITLNFKTEQGRSVFRDLVAKADVVLENFMPGVMERLGLGAEALLEINPRLIYASASGYGTSGPNRDHLAMDLTIQAMSGAMHVTGYADRPPVKAGPAISDFLGGIHLYGAIVTALLERERTGRGRTAEIAMQDAMYPTLASNLTLYYEDPKRNPRTGNKHGALAMAPYNSYLAKDGYIAIICVTEGHWPALCEAMGHPELGKHERYATHTSRCEVMSEVDELVTSWTSNLTRAEIMAASQAYRFPCAPVRTLDEVVHDRHMHERGMLSYVDHPELGEVVLPNSPLRFHQSAPLVLKPNPGLGEHNNAVLSELLGLSAAAIDTLRQQGAF
ncbi:formyl-coenzyme A transferase Frc (plasmid) [Cupriavidus necator N-1]|uniref:Formyl-coenzyme A transferase Frc n=1 Tax=Cupriavidus necator (strain ATCC 43291 / DSM 13513 / CCUG 52238 / LMG 8453 / N-1) TaxID=1042878 RepID=F8GVV2_CUPNN|nr:CoA transferase [Cupriavidus necator]AEI81594.1 formyl-coenzyme A transferase Frc [Cupriavidus necator N-1]MDX6007964.1 CoA transferase [Cupriavidus necator]